MEAAKEEKNLPGKYSRFQLIVLGRIGSVDLILLAVWLQIQILVTLNLWGDIVITMIF